MPIGGYSLLSVFVCFEVGGCDLSVLLVVLCFSDFVNFLGYFGFVLFAGLRCGVFWVCCSLAFSCCGLFVGWWLYSAAWGALFCCVLVWLFWVLFWCVALVGVPLFLFWLVACFVMNGS